MIRLYGGGRSAFELLAAKKGKPLAETAHRSTKVIEQRTERDSRSWLMVRRADGTVVGNFERTAEGFKSAFARAARWADAEVLPVKELSCR